MELCSSRSEYGNEIKITFKNRNRNLSLWRDNYSENKIHFDYTHIFQICLRWIKIHFAQHPKHKFLFSKLATTSRLSNWRSNYSPWILFFAGILIHLKRKNKGPIVTFLNRCSFYVQIKSWDIFSVINICIRYKRSMLYCKLN